MSDSSQTLSAIAKGPACFNIFHASIQTVALIAVMICEHNSHTDSGLADSDGAANRICHITGVERPCCSGGDVHPIQETFQNVVGVSRIYDILGVEQPCGGRGDSYPIQKEKDLSLYSRFPFCNGDCSLNFQMNSIHI